MLSPFFPADWDAVDPEADPSIINLHVDDDELLAFEGLLAVERALSRFALIALTGLFGWMVIRVAIAIHAGRM